MMRKTTFKGTNVFMSRNLVPPEIFDSLHDILKDNGADIFLCCDPSRNGPDDYHIISSRDHEKFDDLRGKGCKLLDMAVYSFLLICNIPLYHIGCEECNSRAHFNLGPQCVFSCAKEHIVLSKQGFTCCLAMDGVKILTSGFEVEEKVEIDKLVTAMGGLLQTKASSDVNFVIVKNVLAGKYKWALNNLKKPIVSESWLHQCWKEHRIVPYGSYKVLPFSGLTISVTQVPLDELKEIEKLVLQNGGTFSAELTRKNAPEGDKYKVAKRWGHLHIVTRAWFNQSVSRKACLNEESYPVQGRRGTYMNSQMTSLKVQHSQDKVIRNSQCGLPSISHQEISCDGMADADLGAPLSQNMSSTVFDILGFRNEDNRPPVIQHKRFMNIDGCVAEDSQSVDSGLYLLECKIHLAGFDASEMLRLVNMVRRGGGSRYMSLNEQLTHIVVGTPSENEKKEVRSLSAMGVINVVRTLWLEDCEREKKEIPVLRKHIAYDLLLPKAISFSKGSVSAMPGLKQANPSTMHPTFPNDQSQSLNKAQPKVQHGISDESQDNKSSVFKGRSFRFSSYFPDIQRAEIVDWIHEGGGEVVDTRTEKTVNYTVESHGVLCNPTQFSVATKVSSHWIYSCLQDGYLLDVSSHILFSPLQCKVPLPGFIGLNFCVSQYEEKDRALLRNLCHILGGRLFKRLTKKVNYVICKFTEGPRYEAARELGIQTVTIEWIWECIKQNKIVASNQFLPREAAISDQEAGICTMSQYPTQEVRMISTADASQLTLNPKVIDRRVENRVCIVRKEVPKVIDGKLKAEFAWIISTENKVNENGGEISKSVPDVAATIEDLLEQTSKIHDPKSPTASDKIVSEVFTSDCSRLDHDLHAEDPHSVFGWSNRWTRRDDITNPGGEENTNIYGGFSETQPESQVVSYEEDLSGRQIIINRVRTKSGLTSNPLLTQHGIDREKGNMRLKYRKHMI